jgi:terminal uridylyltransferase
MVLYFLVHVKQPPVLPNLQRIAPLRPLSEDDVMIQGRNVYFFDDTETLRQEWSSINFETVGELYVFAVTSGGAYIWSIVTRAHCRAGCRPDSRELALIYRLIDFFRFFSHDFQFNNSVMSLRAGQLTKESKGWVNDIDVGGLNELARDRNRLCIEVSCNPYSHHIAVS